MRAARYRLYRGGIYHLQMISIRRLRGSDEYLSVYIVNIHINNFSNFFTVVGLQKS